MFIKEKKKCLNKVQSQTLYTRQQMIVPLIPPDSKLFKNRSVTYTRCQTTLLNFHEN